MRYKHYNILIIIIHKVEKVVILKYAYFTNSSQARLHFYFQSLFVAYLAMGVLPTGQQLFCLVLPPLLITFFQSTCILAMVFTCESRRNFHCSAAKLDAINLMQSFFSTHGFGQEQPLGLCQSSF